MPLRLLLPVLAALSLTLAACGDKTETITQGESEAAFVTLGRMQYQVQLSRQLNPSNEGDRNLMVGIPPAERDIGGKQVWFGVWVRITNKSGKPSRAADLFKIRDTRGTAYDPVKLPSTNVLAYRSSIVKAVYPGKDSVASNSPAGGAFLLFRLPLDALDFRPLELTFANGFAPDVESSIRLDV